MSEDLNQKILDIIEMLGSNDIKDNMAGRAGTVSSNEAESSGKAETGTDNNEQRDNIKELIELFLNSKGNRDFSKTSNNIISHSDPRVNLLKSIKPFLNSRRQNRLNKCINILQMSAVAKLFKEQEEGS